MHGHHDSDHYDVQFTTRQLVLLFGLLMVIVVGVFVGGIVIGRGMAPGMTDTVVARRATPVPPPAKTTPATTARVTEAPAEDTLRLPIRSDAKRDSPTPKPARPAASRVASSSGPASARPASTNPEQLASRTLATSARPARSTPPAAAPRPVDRAAAPQAADRPRNAGAGKFTIQVAAFRDRAAAERMLEQLASRGIEGYLEGTPAGIFRVRVGQFESREAARALAARLESEQFATLVTSR